MTVPQEGPWSFTAEGPQGGMTLLVEPESFRDGYATFTVVETTVWWNDLFTGDWWSQSSGIVRATEEEDAT